MQSKDDHLVYHVSRDWQEADLDDQERAMLRFAAKLNLHPGQVEAEDVDALRAAGFDDRAVLDVVLVTALFNFMNRLADGVGLRAQDAFRQQKIRHDEQVEAQRQPQRAGA